MHVPGAALGPGEELAVRPSAGPASSQPQSGQSRGGHAEVAARGHDQLPVPHAAQLVSGPHMQLSSFMYMKVHVYSTRGKKEKGKGGKERTINK